MRSKFTLVQPGQPQVPTDAFLPQSEYFHSDSWKGGLDASDAPEDEVDGQSLEMQDVEVTQDDRLVVAPGVVVTETLAHTPTQVFLHAGAKFSSSVILVAQPYLGVKESGNTQWFNAGLKAGEFGFTNYAGILLMSNGLSGVYARRPGKLQLDLVPKAPTAFALTVFANRVVLGGTLIDGSMDFMGIQWSDSSNDYKGWDPNLGAAGQSLIGSMRQADKIMDFASLGFETLVVLCRRSIWIGVQTGDEFQPIRFTPRLEDTGCSHRKTIVSTEFGVLFLSDDGVRIFTGAEAPIISAPINPLLGVIDDTQDWSAGFDPKRKRYYLHGPNGTWVLDLVRRRWFRWIGTALNSVFFPAQISQITWDEAVGTWDSQTLTWWQLLPQESGGKMLFVKDTRLGYEDPVSTTFFGTALDPRWFSRRTVAENQDVLITALGSRITYEADADAVIELWLPDKPDGNFEPVTLGTLFSGVATKRAWIPYIHTGRGIGLGIRVVSGRPRIRKVSAEFQRTSLPWEIRDTLQPPQGGGETTVQSLAIIKARSLYYNSYDVGEIQGLRRDINSTPSVFWTVVPTGGRNGGGYALSVRNVNPTGGSFSLQPIFRNAAWGVPEDHPFEAGCVIAFNLFGQALTVPMNCIAAMARHVSLGDGADVPQTIISVRPDRKLQGSILVGGVLTMIQNDLGDQALSTVTVPADGWFALEPQIGVSLADNDKSGFISLQLYTPDGPPEGVEVFRVERCKTRSQSSSDCIGAYAYGTEVCAALGPGLDGIGCDDVHLYGAYGTIKRLMYDTHIGAGVPVANGDIVESTVDYDSSHPNTLSADHATVGGPTSHGVSPRVNNLSGGPTRPNFDEHTVDETQPNNVIQIDFEVGLVSGFTGAWLPNLNGAGVGPHVWPGPDDIIRNTIEGEQTDTYRIQLLRNDIAEVLGVSIWTAVTSRLVDAFLAVAGGGSEHFNWTGPHRFDQQLTGNSILRVGLRLAGVSDIGRYFANPIFGFGGPDWRPPGQYTKEPWTVHEKDPTLAAWTPESLALVQPLIKGDLSIANTDPDPTTHWVRFDFIQMGIEYAYRRAKIVAVERPPIAPIAGLVGGVVDPTTRTVSVQDASTDWDGTVVSRIVDWGDGSPTEALAGMLRTYLGEGIIQPNLTHIYAAPGNYTITSTVTDNDALVSTATLPIVLPNQLPVAEFSTAANPGDLTGQTIDFTDLSADPDGTIASWDWDFGDGSLHSTLQNPTHAYVGAGTRTVTLVVTDNLGGTGSVSHPVTTPVVVGTRVNMPVLWSNSMAAGLNQSLERFDFTGGSESVAAGGGRDGNNAIQEGTTSGVFQYTFRSIDPHAFQFGFNWSGQALPAKEVPLFMVGNENVAVVLRPDGKVRVYALDGSFAWQQAFETAAAVPLNAPVVGQLRFGFGAAGTGYVRLWINGETLVADPIAVNPGGSLTMVGDTLTLGSGSGGNFGYTPAGGYASGNASMLWFDIACFDDSAVASDHTKQPGDVHFALARPNGIGTFNDTGLGSATDLQSDDHATSATTFTATGQQVSCTVNTPTLVGTPTVLCVLPYYEAFRGGTTGTKTLSVFLLSGVARADSSNFSASSSWTSRYHIIPGDTADAFPLPHDPATSANWANAAAVGATEVGFKAVAINSGGNVPLSQLGLEVAYWDS